MSRWISIFVDLLKMIWVAGKISRIWFCWVLISAISASNFFEIKCCEKEVWLRLVSIILGQMLEMVEKIKYAE